MRIHGKLLRRAAILSNDSDDYRSRSGYNGSELEIKDFTQANPNSIYHAVASLWYAVFDPNRNPTAIVIPQRYVGTRARRKEERRGEERRGESGNERLRIRRNYTAKLHGAINPCALIVTSLRNRKLSAIDGNHRASSGRNETVAETSP